MNRPVESLERLADEANSTLCERIDISEPHILGRRKEKEDESATKWDSPTAFSSLRDAAIGGALGRGRGMETETVTVTTVTMMASGR